MWFCGLISFSLHIRNSSHTDLNLAADAVADQAREISKNTHLSRTINWRAKLEKQIIVLSQNVPEQKKSSSLCQK